MANEVLPADELAQFKTDLGYVVEGLGDPSRSCTYRQVTVATVTVTSGAIAETAASGTVLMTRHQLSAKQGQEGQEAGSVTYLVTQAALAAIGVTEPNRRDRIVDGSDTYEVVDYEPDPLGAAWWLKCSKVATL